MGVDSAVASIGKEELGGLHVEVILEEGGDALGLTIMDEVREYRGIVGFIVVYEPPNPWVEPWQGL